MVADLRFALLVYTTSWCAIGLGFAVVWTAISILKGWV